MAWKNVYLDLIFVPLALASSLFYQAWLWYTLKRHPHRTYLAMNKLGQRAWISHIMKDNDNKKLLAVLTIRNNIMGATLMSRTSVVISCGLLIFASKAYTTTTTATSTITTSDNNHHHLFPLMDGDDTNDLQLDCKVALLLLAFLAVFFCQSLSIICLTQVNILINLLAIDGSMLRKEHVLALLDKGIFMCTVGNRIFFTTLPLMLWIFGPVLVFVCSVGTVAILYSVDIVNCEKGGIVGVDRRVEEEDGDSVPV